MAETENLKDTAVSDPKNDDQNGDEKDENIEVHSANAWEKADLGDEDRKNKFLRLMGAGKKEHHGRFVIGDHDPDNARKTDETQKLQHQLEDQYTHSMQHRLAGGRRGHVGLGYHDADLDAKPQESEQQNTKEDSDNDGEAEQGTEDVDEKKDGDGDEIDKVKDRPGEVTDKPDNRKRESTGSDAEEDAPEEKKMKFVKSSS